MAILGYTYQGENYTPGAIVRAVTSSPAYDGWALGEGITMPVEENLDEMAHAFGIDRQDEWSFDSEDFPKVIDDELSDVPAGVSFRTETGDYVDAHGNEVD